ncbi:nickel-dependent lactate racemase [Kushneria sinocarnis]|uniref:Nickel-dependent lactate racemase n=1 Tax=Kushneria sinocarnis TaxID=595502 RepID=A0A420WU07_9GAMM|nr:nickel-dependent lactate racemase [Kushneria sinocarnis]RKQ96921.1 nickel-dependent lactate racemase [Kushneria sinocarnis]
MQTSLLYGRGELPLDLPEDTFVVEPPVQHALAAPEDAIRAALDAPIDTPALKEMVRAEDRVAIVISDITRPTPNHLLVPLLIDTLAHVPHDHFVIINGTGTHRDQTEDELRGMLGDWVVDHIEIINNHCDNYDELINVGDNSFGCPSWLNRRYVEADFRIVTGFIEPHFFAGFSGGPKGIMPGIAGLETIMTFHNARMIGDPRSTWGNMADNPLQAMTREINALCPPHFMLNVTLNRDKAITKVFAGDMTEAHRRGCEHELEHAMVRCDERFDVVITGNSGYPLDQNLYQAVKGMSAAHKIVREGGTIIMAAECSDGIPEHGKFAEILTMADTPQALLEMIEDPEFAMLDQWQVQKQAVIQSFANVMLYSTLSDDHTRRALLEPTHDIEATLATLQKRYGNGMRVAVMPLGPLTVPYVDE